MAQLECTAKAPTSTGRQFSSYIQPAGALPCHSAAIVVGSCPSWSSFLLLAYTTHRCRPAESTVILLRQPACADVKLPCEIRCAKAAWLGNTLAFTLDWQACAGVTLQACNWHIMHGGCLLSLQKHNRGCTHSRKSLGRRSWAAGGAQGAP